MRHVVRQLVNQLLVGLCAMFLMAGASKAGSITDKIIVSGDSSIGNGIDGSEGITKADNGIFFSNILDGGTKVVLQSFSFGHEGAAAISTWYTEHGATVIMPNPPGTITASELAGARLFISVLPAIAYTPAELTLMRNFLADGNIIFFIGEFGTFFPQGNALINSTLSSLGSTLRIDNALLDPFNHVATGSQIATHPLTRGVTAFSYAATSAVSGGTPLFFTTNGTPFVEATNFIPEPGTLSLLGTGLIGLAGLARRKLKL